MSSQWNNKYAIMRDLSLAQGCVPVVVEDTLTAGERPRGPDVVEETEEEFFRNCAGVEEINDPDLGMIKQMLNMVHDFDCNLRKTPENVDNKIMIKKVVESVPPAELNHTNNVGHPKPTMKTVKSHRNVAINSIKSFLNKMTDSENSQNKPGKPVKLLKPVDFKQTENELKVDKWLDGNKPMSLDQRTDLLAQNPGLMFRRKQGHVGSLASKEAVKSTHEDATAIQYVPSKLANEYYRKYEERSQMKQIVHEDIWTKAERQMREIDARRNLEAEKLQAEMLQAEKLEAEKLEAKELEVALAASLSVSATSLSQAEEFEAALAASLSTSATSSSETEVDEPTDTPALPHGMDAVRLPMYRHLLTGECVVCKVLCRTEPSSDDSKCDE